MLPELATALVASVANPKAFRSGRDFSSRIYGRPALLKSFAAFPAAWKVVAASLAVIATVVSTSHRLPPAAAASIAEAAALLSGNSPITNQSWRPKVRYQPMSLPPTLLKRLETASRDFRV